MNHSLSTKKNYGLWLTDDLNYEGVSVALRGFDNLKLVADPVSKELFDNNLMFGDLVRTKEFLNVPRIILTFEPFGLTYA